MFIYVIVCSETLKIYVGQHKGENLQKYLQTKQSNARRNSGARSHLFAAMRVHPKDSWSIHPLVSDVRTRGELDELERHYIRALKAQHPDVGYNICEGGEGFTGPASAETRQKHSVSMKAYYASGSPAALAHRQISASHVAALIEGRRRAGSQCGMRGKKHSLEAKQKMQVAAAGRTGESNPFFGRQHSEEAKRKNAIAHRKPWSAARRAAYEKTAVPKIPPTPEETHRRRSEAAKRRFANPEERAKQSARLKGKGSSARIRLLVL
jgi:group I intron endonuclease